MKRALLLSMSLAFGSGPGLGCSEVDTVGPTPGAPATQTQAQAVVFPSPEGTRASEYTLQPATWRLYGVQLGDIRTAVFADTRTWATKEVREGELLSRNLLVDRLSEDAAALTEPDGTTHIVSVGEDFTLLVVRHLLDDALTYQGRGNYRVDVPKFEMLRARYGVGGSTEIFRLPGLSGLKLVNVQGAGVLSRMGLKEHDVLLEGTSLDSIVERLSRGEPVVLRVFRKGNLLALRYQPS